MGKRCGTGLKKTEEWGVDGILVRHMYVYVNGPPKMVELFSQTICMTWGNFDVSLSLLMAYNIKMQNWPSHESQETGSYKVMRSKKQQIAQVR